MTLKETYSEVLTIRLTPTQKRQLKASGYDARDAVNYFLKDHNSECKNLKIEQVKLEEKIINLTNLIEDSEIEKAGLEKRLEEVNERLANITDDTLVYNDDISHEVDYIINQYEKVCNKHKGYTFDLFLNGQLKRIEERCRFLNVEVNTFLNLVEEKIND